MLSLFALPQPTAQAAPRTAEATDLTEGQQALAQAAASGSRVEVVGERSERATVFANPDGSTFTLERSVVPVRVAKAGGGWQVPDPTLEQRADGSVGPKAASLGMTFSGGGGDPLATISDQGRSLTFEWPDALPEPQLDGPSALYPEVMAGVDLKVTATVESFQQVLVIKTPEAAADPELKKLTFGLKAQGLSVRQGAAGNLAAVDGNGNTVFRAPPAQMWDSAGAASPTQPQAREAAEGGTEAGDTAEAGSSGTGLAPGQGDNVSQVDVHLEDGSMAIVPDSAMLEGTDADAFPLFIDPPWGASERILLRSDGYESYGWGNGSDGQGMGAGKCGTWDNHYCGPGYTQRLYFEFSPAELKGKKVLDATFRVTEPWAFQCSPRTVDLVRTNNISTATTWSSRPKELDWMVDRYVSAGRGSLCDPDSPQAAIEFNDSPEEPNENLTPTVQAFAAGKFSRLTLEIRAHDESDTSAWKRFKNDAVLAVDFVGLPAKPTGTGIITGSGTVCEESSIFPSVVTDPQPSLTATAQTASGGESGAQLRVYFDIDRRNADGTWSDADPGNGSERPSTGYVGDGRTVTLAWSALSDGTLYRYQAWTWSYYGASHLTSPSSGFCYFKIDRTAPQAPSVTFGTVYSPCTAQACVPGGGPGVKDTFTFGPGTGDVNAAYMYKLSSDTKWSSDLGGATAKKDITPQRSGTYQLQVRAKDPLGRWGATRVVEFLVAVGEGPVARWRFDEASGAAKDSAEAGTDRHDAVLNGGAVRDNRGRRGEITRDSAGQPLAEPVTDKGLALNGSTGYATTSGPALETRASYTVSAWVRLDDGSRNRTFVSQDGAHRSSFYLGYQLDVRKWTFRAVNADAAAGASWSYERVESKDPATLKVWTHLTGVFDAEAKTLSFYVNGLLQGTVPYTTAWAAQGPVQIGRTRYSDTYTDYVAGSVDEVTMWQRALPGEEIAEESKLLTSGGFAGAELVAEWTPDHPSVTPGHDTAADYGRALALSGGASVDGAEIVLDGVDDAATTPGPLVDDTGSFTVTTLVTLDEAKLAAKGAPYVGQVLGQRTASGSAWGLWYQVTRLDTELDEQTLEERVVPVGLWHFGRLNTDGSFTSVASDEEASLGSPVRLTGIFDAQDGTISLHVGQDLNGAPKTFTAQQGAGDFAIGKGVSAGSWQHFLPGRIAEVRVWAGAMAGETQLGSVVGS
ncbi:LamG domain protein jellyroll fold domain protein (plasmid) [Streptomyces poriferorum]|uniref:LamG-like jellyroll fold domain-containing protein n=1 Tax=Streptomyces poriferorum TaxID=2798799 RepID=UPI00273D08F3|nr:LamG-like jellyroll fold domain-containing protein [Streptomyces sp. Alt1]WLQ53887.1 LamG domain protein jellyroll fold domain protein [Streptomyces sp. Alt1]